MTTAEILTAHDRCARLAHWKQSWEFNRLHPRTILRRSVEAGLLTDDPDPGQFSGDHVMQLCADRGLDIEGSVYSTAMNVASLSDLLVTLLRARMPNLGRPADKVGETLTWVSSCLLAPSGVRLHRVVLADRWNKDKELAESHAWFSLGEMAIYGLPLTTTVILTGQLRDGKFHSPFSKGWLHPKSHQLRIRKRSGEGFSGQWTPCWREEQDEISRDKWMDQLHEDGVLRDILFDVDLPQPCPELRAKIRNLAEKKLQAIAESKALPPPHISVCFQPKKCEFSEACWGFSEPSEKSGFVQLDKRDIP